MNFDFLDILCDEEFLFTSHENDVFFGFWGLPGVTEFGTKTRDKPKLDIVGKRRPFLLFVIFAPQSAGFFFGMNVRTAYQYQGGGRLVEGYCYRKADVSRVYL